MLPSRGAWGLCSGLCLPCGVCGDTQQAQGEPGPRMLDLRWRASSGSRYQPGARSLACASALAQRITLGCSRGTHARLISRMLGVRAYALHHTHRTDRPRVCPHYVVAAAGVRSRALLDCSTLRQLTRSAGGRCSGCTAVAAATGCTLSCQDAADRPACCGLRFAAAHPSLCCTRASSLLVCLLRYLCSPSDMLRHG